MFINNYRYKKVVNAVRLLQHAYRGWRDRITFLRKRRAAIVIQKRLRGMFAREVCIISVSAYLI